MIALVFQSVGVRASLPDTGSAEYNQALASHGAIALASSSYLSSSPAFAIDGNTSTYWQSGDRTGWLAATFPHLVIINEIHIHFLETRFPSLSLYFDVNGNGLFETTEKVWSTTTNGVLGVVVITQAKSALGVKIAIDAKVASRLPKIAEFEAYLRGDTDGDGLTNAAEAATTYYQDMKATHLPTWVPSAATDTVLFYDMETKAADGRLEDLSGRGNRGTIVEATPVPGKVQFARSFDGVNDYVEAAPSATLDLSGGITISMWIQLQSDPNCDGSNNWRVLLSKRAASGSAWGSYFLFLEENRLPSWTVSSSGLLRRFFPTSGVIPIGSWTHIAFARDASSGMMSYYVNGALADSRQLAAGPIDPSGGSLRIGGGRNTGCPNEEGFTPATIDEVQIWGRALSDAEVKYASTRGGEPPAVTAALAPFRGVPMRALAAFSVDHPVRGALTAAIGYWDGSAWNTRNVWDPSGRLSAPPPPSGGGGGGGGGGGCCIRVLGPPGNETLNATEFSVWADPITDQASDQVVLDTTAVAPSFATSLGILTAEWALGEVDTGTRYTVVVDLVVSQSTASSAENASGILRPTFPISLFTTFSMWRLLVFDWTSQGAGQVLNFTVRFEAKTDPTQQDTDQDGLSDYTEATQTLTLPVTADSELDGLSDGYEVVPHPLTLSVNGQTVTLPSFTTDPKNGDTDGDGLSDGWERGSVGSKNITDPRNPDTDGDGLRDGDEVQRYGSDPTRRDTDGDGIPDNVEVTPRTLTLTINGAAQARLVTTLPYAADTDGDGIRDDMEWFGTNPWNVVTDPSDSDTDDDGLYDGGEAYLQEVAMDGRAPLGTFGSRSVVANPTGVVATVEVRYSTSGADIGSIQVRVDHNGISGPLLRTGGGSGNFLHESSDITAVFPGTPKTGSYSISVWSSAGDVVLEEFAVRFRIQTSPVRTDTDGDGLNDKEEIVNGQDGWVTDPNVADTDGDGWTDSVEYSHGTNPLLADTDQDGVRDPIDIDPLHNLLVAVTVEKIHHGNLFGATGSPTLMAVIRMNDDNTYATEHRQASEESVCSIWIFVCVTSVWSTGVFSLTYYADVPDDRSDVRVRILASDIDIFTGDDPLVDVSINYRIGDTRAEKSWSSDNLHWVSYRVETVKLDKVRTLAVTDGQSIASDQFGTPRYAQPERFAVLLLQASSSYGEIGSGLNAILVPESLFARSNLKARFVNGTTSPLGDATFYDGDATKATMSEGIAALIAAALSGYDAWVVLQYLLQDYQGTLIFQVVDVTGRVFGLNVPGDVIRVIPWAGVSNGPTGEMPQNFWQKVGAVATTLLNSLVYVGQLIYGGLIAIGSFLSDLGQAIYNWGMHALGFINSELDKVKQAVDRAVKTLENLLSWALDWVMKLIHSLLDPVIDSIRKMIEDFQSGIVRAFSQLTVETTADSITTLLGEAIFGSQLFFVLLLLIVGISVAEKITMVGTGGVGAIVMNTIIPLVRDLLIASIVGMVVVKVLNTVLPEADQVSSLVPRQFSDAAKLTFGFSSFFQKLALYAAGRDREWNSIALVESAFRMAIVSFILMLMRFAVDASVKPTTTAKASLMFLDGIAIYMAWVAKVNLGKAKGPLSHFYPLMSPVGDALTIVAQVSSVASLIEDAAALGAASGKW